MWHESGKQGQRLLRRDKKTCKKPRCQGNKPTSRTLVVRTPDAVSHSDWSSMVNFKLCSVKFVCINTTLWRNIHIFFYFKLTPFYAKTAILSFRNPLELRSPKYPTSEGAESLWGHSAMARNAKRIQLVPAAMIEKVASHPPTPTSFHAFMASWACGARRAVLRGGWIFRIKSTSKSHLDNNLRTTWKAGCRLCYFFTNMSTERKVR